METTGYFGVGFAKYENQIESVSFTTSVYLPELSVMVPLPEVLRTLTASSPIFFERSYTVPLTRTCADAKEDVNKRISKL
jgi:hypothetical protein